MSNVNSIHDSRWECQLCYRFALSEIRRLYIGRSRMPVVRHTVILLRTVRAGHGSTSFSRNLEIMGANEQVSSPTCHSRHQIPGSEPLSALLTAAINALISITSFQAQFIVSITG